jgi:hypothetical protein
MIGAGERKSVTLCTRNVLLENWPQKSAVVDCGGWTAKSRDNIILPNRKNL